MWDRDTVHKRLTVGSDINSLQSIWYDTREKSTGLRLNDLGFDILTQNLGLQYWCYPMDAKTLHPKNLLSLDRYLTCPYYLRRRQRQFDLILLGDRESVMASIYGDVERFIASLCDQ